MSRLSGRLNSEPADWRPQGFNNVGGIEPLLFDPVNVWTATLIGAIALDLAASHARQTPSGRTE